MSPFGSFVLNLKEIEPELGAFHGAEIPYVFGSLTPPTTGDRLLNTRMQQYWTRFAEKGRAPRAKKGPAWPRFRPKTYEMLRLDGSGELKDVRRIKDFRRTECDFWSSQYEQQ